MITMGINDKPRYPSTRPAMAMPFPPKRPALFWISERDKWPMITATIAAGRHCRVTAGCGSGRDQVSAAEGAGLRIIFDCFGTVRARLHRDPPSGDLLKRNNPE